jgi:hypothetical protein
MFSSFTRSVGVLADTTGLVRLRAYLGGLLVFVDLRQTPTGGALAPTSSTVNSSGGRAQTRPSSTGVIVRT